MLRWKPPWKLLTIPRSSYWSYSVLSTSRCLSAKSSSGSCIGCGKVLQTSDNTQSGFIPASVSSTFNNGWKRTVSAPTGMLVPSSPEGVEVNRVGEDAFRIKATKPYCQRCFKIQQYRTDIRFGFSPDHQPWITGWSATDVCDGINENCIVVNVIDVTDFESSLVPELIDVLARRRIPVIHVLNKMDCLPVRTKDWASVVSWACRLSRILLSSTGIDGKLNVIPISSKSEFNLDLLEKRVGMYLSERDSKDIHIVGRQNSGKSTLANRFLHFIRYKHLGRVHYKRAVGGITRSPLPGTTVDKIRVHLGDDICLLDGPGIEAENHISKYFSSSEDYRGMYTGQRYQPLSHVLKEGKCLIIGAMCRLEVASGSSAVITCFTSPQATVHICNANSAIELLERKAGTFLYPPHSQAPNANNPDGNIHPIVNAKWVRHRVSVYCGPSTSHDDISISGVGWFAVSGQGHKEVDVFVPEGVQVFRRPSMLPHFLQRSGASPFNFRLRGRSISINRRKKAHIRTLRASQDKSPTISTQEGEIPI